MRPSAKRGLTLVELLVIIGVIVGLVAILMPTLTSATDRSRMTECRSNLTRIGIAMRTYRSDYGDWPPNLGALQDAGLIADENTLVCAGTDLPYFYFKPDAITPAGRFVVSCCPASTPEGQRPHDHGSAFVGMKASGEAATANHRGTEDGNGENDHENSSRVT